MRKLLSTLAAMLAIAGTSSAETVLTDVFSAGSQIYDAVGTTQGGHTANWGVTSDITKAEYTFSSSGATWPTTCVYASATGSAAPGALIVPKDQYIEIKMPAGTKSVSFDAYQLTSGKTCDVVVTLGEETVKTFTVGNIVDGKAENFVLDGVKGGETYRFTCTCAAGFKYMWRVFNMAYTIEEPKVETQLADIFSAGSQIYDAVGTTQGGHTANWGVTSDITKAEYTFSSSGATWPTTCVYASATGSAAPGALIVPKDQYIEIKMPAGTKSVSFDAYQLTSGKTCDVVVTLGEETVKTFTVGNIVDGKAENFVLDGVKGGETYRFTCTCAAGFKYMWRVFNMVYTIESSGAAAMPEPIFQPAAGSIRPDTPITLMCPGKDEAKIYYTTDGTTPTAQSTLYTAPFTLSQNCTVKAIAIGENGASDSEVAEAAYTILELTNFKLVTSTDDITSDPCIIVGKGDDMPVLYFSLNTQPIGMEYREAYCLPDDQILGDYVKAVDPTQAQYITITKGETGKDAYPYLLSVGTDLYLGSSGTAGNPLGLSTTAKNKLCYANLSFNSVNNACVIEFNNTDVEGYALLFSSLSRTSSTFNYFPLTGTAARLPVYLYQKSTETPTGISTTVENVESGEATYYDLMGRRIQNPQNGIYVKVLNGKASKIAL